MLVRDNIYQLRNDIKTVFPERFDNEIYNSFGKTATDQDVIRYTSNFSIKYIESGEEEYRINGRYKKVLANKMLIVNDKSKSSLISADANALSIFINPQIFTDCLQGMLKTSKFLEEPFNDTDKTIFFFDDVQDVDRNLKHFFDRLTTNRNAILTIDFFYELCEQILCSQNKLQTKINRLSGKKIATRMETFKRVEKGKEYINDTLTKAFNLDEVSKTSCLSKFHFIRLFKEVYGITPNRYHLLRKLGEVETCIKRNDNPYSLNEIAIDFGFSNYSLFYKQFKQVYGFAPSELKERSS
jgi:AraC-like DNA-binding protein